MCLGSFQEVSRKSAQIYETSSLVGSGGSLNATPHSGYNSGSTMWEACACRILSHTDACRGPSLRNVELLVPKSICANFKREGLNSSTWKLWALAPSTSASAPNATTFRVCEDPFMSVFKEVVGSQIILHMGVSQQPSPPPQYPSAEPCDIL